MFTISPKENLVLCRIIYNREYSIIDNYNIEYSIIDSDNREYSIMDSYNRAILY